MPTVEESSIGIGMSQAGSYSISSDAKMLDFYFYTDPVAVGKTATFRIYTDNTTSELELFSLKAWATPVPVPAAAWLLGSGVIGLAAVRRRSRG
jgi:hypothetical protein